MNKYTAMLFPFFAIILWAGNVIVSKLSATTIHPSAITFYRVVLAVTLMSFFLLIPVWKNRAIIFQHIGKLFFLGFLSMAFYQSLSYLAAQTTTATNMSIITALTPLLTMILSVVLLRDKPTTGMVIGGGLSLSGLIYLVSHGEPQYLLSNGIHIGDGLMLIASSSYALYSVLLRRWNLPIKGFESIYLQAWSSLIVMAPVMLFIPAEQAVLNRETIPLIIYAGIFASIILPFLWLQGIKFIGPNRCSIFLNLLPVFTATIAITCLDEKLYFYHLTGGLVIIAGILIAQLWKKSFHVDATAQKI